MKGKKFIEAYKQLYSGADKIRNGVGIVANQDFKDKIANVRKFGDKIKSQSSTREWSAYYWQSCPTSWLQVSNMHIKFILELII